MGEINTRHVSEVAISTDALEDPNPADLDEDFINRSCYAYVDEGKWTDDSIKLLIQLFKERECEFRNPERKKKQVWESIGSELNKEGYLFTTDQVDTKWRNLKKAYWRSKEAQSGLGCHSRFTYEDLLDEIYGHTLPKKFHVSRVTPRVIRRALIRDGSGTGNGSRSLKKILGEDSGDQGKWKIPPPELGDIAAILERMRQDRKSSEEEKNKQEEEKMKLLIQMHEEEMQAMKELVEVVGSVTRNAPFEDE